MALTWKFFYTSILPSNHFRTSDAQREREREREWARRESTGGRPAKLRPAQIVPPPPPPPPPRSRRLIAQKEERVKCLLAHNRSRHKESRDRRDHPSRSPRNWWLPFFLQSFDLYLLFRWNWWLRSLRFEENGSLGCGLWPVVWVFIGLWWVCW